MKTKNLAAWLILGGGLAYLIYRNRGAISDLGQQLLANLEALTNSLPNEAQPYAEVIQRVAQEQQVDPLLIAAIGSYESGWGTLLSPKGPGGTADNGHGHGLMQIDDRTWGSWLSSNDWTDPYTNVSQGISIFKQSLGYFTQKGVQGDLLLQAALAGYNAGPGRVWQAMQGGQAPDSVTWGQKYSSEVIGRLAKYTATAQAEVAAA